MSTTEGIKAYRSLEQEPWLQEFKAVAPEILGEGALNFSDHAQRTQELEILGASRFVSLRGIYPEVEEINGEELAEAAEDGMPQSFSSAVTLETTGPLRIKYMTDPNEERRRVLTADMYQRSIVVNEQNVLEGIVDKKVGLRPSWKPILRIKLAVVNDGHSIPERDLHQLSYFLPEEMSAKPGEIIPITIGPGAVRDQGVEMAEFSRDITHEAAQGVAEATASAA